MQLQQKFASNIAVESEFLVHFFIRREMCNSPFLFPFLRLNALGKVV